MLETLLNHFQSYGMNDLEFIIVNSKLSHSQERLHELKRRVSFEVFQETEEEEVWNLMEGGKDDMYIYDRCGRLTFYIPFPLSILNESPLVANAILTTYFRSPCGDKCSHNNTMDVDQFVKNLEKNIESSNETEQMNETYVEAEVTEYNTETYNDTYASNDLLSVINTVQEENDVSNTSLSSNATDYEYPEYDNLSNLNDTSDTNDTSVDEAKTYFNNIYRLFFDIENVVEDKQETNQTLMNETTISTVNEQTLDHNYTREHENNIHTLHQYHNHHSHHQKKHKSDSKETKKSDRCLEADYQVCRSWTKKRLLHAQRCCTGKKSEAETAHPRSCDNFGKKRCKKIQSILKCCIKTLYTEPAAVVLSNETTVTPKEESSAISEIDTEHQQIIPIQNGDIVCCKPANEGKLCRVINSGSCEEGEYIESSPNEAKCQNVP